MLYNSKNILKMLHGVTQLLLVLISTCLFSLYCFCLGWRHGLVEDRQTSLLLEAPACIAEVVWRRGMLCVPLWDGGSAWLLPFLVCQQGWDPISEVQKAALSCPSSQRNSSHNPLSSQKKAGKETSIPLAGLSVWRAAWINNNLVPGSCFSHFSSGIWL